MQKRIVTLLPFLSVSLLAGCSTSSSPSSYTDGSLTLSSITGLATPSYRKSGNNFIFTPSETKKTGISLSGSLDGYLMVDGGSLTDHKSIEFDLNGVNITASDEPPLYWNSHNSKMFVRAMKGTNNVITYNGTGDKMGAIFSENNLEVLGEGTIETHTKAGHGFRGDDLTFSGTPTLKIDAAHDGVHSKNLTATSFGGAFSIGTVGSEAFDICDDDTAASTYSGYIHFATGSTLKPTISIAKCLSVFEADNSFTVTSPLSIECTETTGSIVENVNPSSITMTVEGSFTANGKSVLTQDVATKS